jgi:Putative transposase of IS4/5 family (DUF4096)
MRYELSDDEWTAIKLMLPNKPRGVPRVNDRRVLNGIFWVLRSGAPWRSVGQHSTTLQSQRSDLLQPASLSSQESGRAVLQQDQALPACGNALRQTRCVAGLHRQRAGSCYAEDLVTLGTP